MNFDFDRVTSNMTRQVETFSHDDRRLRKIVLCADFATSLETLWCVLTDAEILAKWFQRVSGELCLNGQFHIQDNASGTVISCERGQSFSITWEFAGDTSWVDVSFSKTRDGTSRLSISHTMNFSEHWTHFGPGATGVGWELSLYGLAHYLRHADKPKFDEEKFVSSPMGRTAVRDSSDSWAEAGIASGIDADIAYEGAKRTTAFYLGDEIA